VLKSALRIRCLKKQQSFLKSKGKDMVRRSLKTMDKLDKAKEKEKQIKSKQAATAATLSNNLILSVLVLRVKANPFVNLEVPLLPPQV
jgi:hypothetical protein